MSLGQKVPRFPPLSFVWRRMTGFVTMLHGIRGMSHPTRAGVIIAGYRESRV